MIRLRIAGRRSGHEHDPLRRHAIRSQPVFDELAPIPVFILVFDRIHAVGKRQTLADSGIRARCNQPDWRFAARKDPRRRTAVVQLDVPDPQGKLKPGMFAQLAIQLGQRSGALLVPKEAVLRMAPVDPSAPLQNVIFTVASGRVHRQAVSTGVSDGKNVEIVQGLQEGIDLVLNPRPDFIEGELISADRVRPLLHEASELVAIFVSSRKSAASNLKSAI